MKDSDRTDLSSSATAHRLPTISASQAFQKLSETDGKWVTTGLSRLDNALRANSFPSLLSQDSTPGGYAKGQITEIYGPPGSGKTALGLEAAFQAIRRGSNVFWIDASFPVHASRFNTFVSGAEPSPSSLDRFHHLVTPSLPYLLALICHPPSDFPPAGTTLLIIDGANSPFTATYPDNAVDTLRASKKTPDISWAANRRYSVMAEFLSKLTKLAAIRDLAVVLLCQTSIKVRTEYGAVLRPSIWTKSWNEGIQNRVVLFRDFWRGVDGEKKTGVRFVAVVKRNGVDRGRLDGLVPFMIDMNGCQEVETEVALPVPAAPVITRQSPMKRKRKREEVADSQSDSDDELIDPLDRTQDVDESETAQLLISYAEAEEDDSDLADFAAVMDEPFDDI